jgi:hypothetical protein
MVPVALCAAFIGAGTACGAERNAGSGAGAGGEFVSSPESPEAEAVSFGESLAQIRGHHRVSLELYRAGDQEGAALHAGHPIAEIQASMQGELTEAGSESADDLEKALADGAGAIAQGATPAELEAAYSRAAELTDFALDEVVGPDASDTSYRASVIASLLVTAGHEYEEAVGGTGIRLLAEYQDGYAFIREARGMYEVIASEVETASNVEAEEIQKAFDRLEGFLPTPIPPKQIADVLDIQSETDLIGHELEETVGAVPVQESDPEDIVAEIESLLDEIVETYDAGDPNAAAELAAEAYLENYEVIEAGVIAAAPEVNAELEPLLGAELRRQITGGASTSEVEAMVERAKELLGKALDALESDH